VLLRGINVGGKARLPMAELRAALGELGYEDVQTYIQSGNIALDGPKTPDAKLAATVEAAIKARFGLGVPVVVRTHDELQAIVAANPFAEHLDEPAKVGVGFAPAKLSTTVRPVQGSVDEFVIRGREVYVYCPHGFGRSKLPNFEARSGPPVTVRNWNTVLKLLSMTER
jgi:uncharacterized protein (DUF1697 family)